MFDHIPENEYGEHHWNCCNKVPLDAWIVDESIDVHSKKPNKECQR